MFICNTFICNAFICNAPIRSAACRHGAIFRAALSALNRAGNGAASRAESSAGLGVYRGIVIAMRFFLTGPRTRPARIALSRVLRFNLSVSATAAALAPPARSCSAYATTASTSTAAPRVARGV
jgi:hypothetical protein